MDAKEEVIRILREHRAQLIRRKKHPICRLPNGKILVTATSPSDKRGWRNCLAQLRRLQSIAPPLAGNLPGQSGN